MPVKWARQWPHLQDVYLPRLLPSYGDVKLIIGLNSTLSGFFLDQHGGEEHKPMAHLTKLGWVAFRCTGTSTSQMPTFPLHLMTSVNTNNEVSQLLQDHFNWDYWESEIHSHMENSVEDKIFIDRVSQSIHQKSGKYVIELPLRDRSKLPNNREMAVQWAASVKRKFKKDNDYKQSYVAAMEKYIE